jgi:hypothetical protein
MAGQKETGGWDGRLRKAMRQRGVSVRALYRSVENRFPTIRGGSYGGVRLYCGSKPPKQPRLDLLEAFATVLEVRHEWLAFGEGARTEAGQEGAEAATAAEVLRLGHHVQERAARIRALVSKEVAKALGVGPPPSGAASPEWLPGAVVLWSRLRTVLLTRIHLSEGEPPPFPEDQAMARLAARAIAAPLRALKINPSEVGDADLSTYVLGITAALAPVLQHHSGPPEEK